MRTHFWRSSRVGKRLCPTTVSISSWHFFMISGCRYKRCSRNCNCIAFDVSPGIKKSVIATTSCSSKSKIHWFPFVSISPTFSTITRTSKCLQLWVDVSCFAPSAICLKHMSKKCRSCRGSNVLYCSSTIAYTRKAFN